jgi:hypothetical protein
MSSYKIEQRRLTHRGREFHFVSYDGQPADLKNNHPAAPPTWFLMSGGKRRAVMPQDPALDIPEVDRRLTSWLDAHAF